MVIMMDTTIIMVMIMVTIMVMNLGMVSVWLLL